MQESKINLQEIAFFLVLIFTTIGFFSVIKPFISDIFVAVILAIIYKKPHAYFIKILKNKKKQKRKATALTMALVFFTIVIPMTFVAIMVSTEVGSGYILFTENWTTVKDYIIQLPNKLSSIPILENIVDDINWQKVANQAGDMLSALVTFVIKLVQTTFINAGIIVIHFFIVLFLLYYLLLDGRALIQRLQYLLPLKDTDEQEMFRKFEQVTDAIVINTFVLGFIEGAYGGTLFAILGISSPFFWGVLMAFLSIIPLVGANTILLPMAMVQFIFGNIVSGIVILVFGCGAIIIDQNIIRPRLDGAKSGIHPAIMFLASMGGLILMGIIGFIAGPMIVGMFLVLWNIFGERYQEKLEKYNKGD